MNISPIIQKKEIVMLGSYYMGEWIDISIIMILISSILLPFTILIDEVNSSDIEVEKIYIQSNDELTSEAALKGWPGNGTEAEPFQINDIVMETSPFLTGLKIANTTLEPMI